MFVPNTDAVKYEYVHRDGGEHWLDIREMREEGFHAWYAAEIEAAKRDAWEEGRMAGEFNEHEHRPDREMTNPYAGDS